ncbi:hypothetical protein [Glaciecola sp. 1036]|uniref:hypothetical protein n=1 Tax=Alteromonadaceae TaxID=72275 RepID=UPI003D012700
MQSMHSDVEAMQSTQAQENDCCDNGTCGLAMANCEGNCSHCHGATGFIALATSIQAHAPELSSDHNIATVITAYSSPVLELIIPPSIKF